MHRPGLLLCENHIIFHRTGLKAQTAAHTCLRILLQPKNTDPAKQPQNRPHRTNAAPEPHHDRRRNNQQHNQRPARINPDSKMKHKVKDTEKVTKDSDKPVELLRSLNLFNMQFLTEKMNQIQKRTDWTQISAKPSTGKHNHSRYSNDRYPMSDSKMSNIQYDIHHIGHQQNPGDQPNAKSSLFE